MTVDFLFTYGLDVPGSIPDLRRRTLTVFMPPDTGLARFWTAWTALSSFDVWTNVHVSPSAYIQSVDLEPDVGTIELGGKPAQVSWTVEGTIAVTFVLEQGAASYTEPPFYPTAHSIASLTLYH
jgi:hypothetical protein